MSFMPENLVNQQPNRTAVRRGSAATTAGTVAWVVLGMVGLLSVSGVAESWLLAACWCFYALGCGFLFSRLAGQAGCGAAVGVIAIAVISVWLVGADLREDLILHSHGREITAVVVSEHVETGSRGGKTWHYSLQHADGTKVPGPTLRIDEDSYRIGDHVTVFEDPDGEVDPRTPHRADPTGEVLTLIALAACSIVLVFFARHRVRSRDRIKKEEAPSSPASSEEFQFREMLRTTPADRRGYIKVPPDKFPNLTQARAAVLARGEGLKTEAFGNRGYWRFAPDVVEEVAVQE